MGIAHPLVASPIGPLTSPPHYEEVLAHPFFNGLDKNKMLAKEYTTHFKPNLNKDTLNNLFNIPSIENKDRDKEDMFDLG